MSKDLNDYIFAGDGLQSFVDPQADQFSGPYFDHGNTGSPSSAGGTSDGSDPISATGLDPQGGQYSDWLFDHASNDSSSLFGGTTDGNDLTGTSPSGSPDPAGPSHVSGLDPVASPTASATGLDLLDFGLADAKGGNTTHGGGGGGSHGGGGGGGSSSATTFVSTGVTGDASQDFNIDVVFNGSWTSAEQGVVQWAADYISQNIITGDVRDDTDLSGNPVDDVTVNMSIGSIDRGGKGAMGNVLAQTSVDAVRDAGTVDQWLPVTSSTTLDSYDLSNSTKEGLQGAWDYIVLHEMLHAMGFYGYIFDQLHLTDANGNFIGANALAAYGNGSSIPLSADGGTASGSHWDENNFAPHGTAMPNELMTQYITDYSQSPELSDVTVAALQDLGYTVTDPSPGADSTVVDSHLLIA